MIGRESFTVEQKQGERGERESLQSSDEERVLCSSEVTGGKRELYDRQVTQRESYTAGQ